jgi:branched-chain amino acid transport system ATP-binding protein
MLLRVDGINTFYGSFRALRNVSLEVDTGEVVTVLGANGAGKSTLLRTISGLIRPQTGKIDLNGRRIDQLSPDAIVKLGISHCPEGKLLFPEMPVYKNLELGAYVRRKDRRLIGKLRQEVYELFPILSDRKKQLAGTLSGGEQQMLAVGRALMSDPSLIMLDEPSLGLAPLVVATIMDVIVRIKQRGTAGLLVEQNAAESLRIANRGYVMETGNVTIADTSVNLMRNEKVRQAYLGT